MENKGQEDELENWCSGKRCQRLTSVDEEGEKRMILHSIKVTELTEDDDALDKK